MIREHKFNSEWWGKPVAIVTDTSFFNLSEQLQSRLVAPFDWVEINSKVDNMPSILQLQRFGFVQVDTQINFRIALQNVSYSESLKSMDVSFANKAPFKLSPEEVTDFEHERYRFLPNVTKKDLTARYCLWGNQIIEDHPEWCLTVKSSNNVQGWFLSTLDHKKRLNLTLAMLKKNAVISGLLLYQRAILAYANKNVRIGWASFSATNIAVLNIYASLGARFFSPTTYWIRFVIPEK